MNILKEMLLEINKGNKEAIELIKYMPEYYAEKLEEISIVCELENHIAQLSNDGIAHEMVRVIKQIADKDVDTMFDYLEEAIDDLLSGKDAVDVLLKYDDILYRYNRGR